ncbi:MAG: hypothetical protein A3G76_13020 [Acidobacteria bacterium RIFCSPLOWO2_12_FULL_65_11]|nr:MAG: hypothetical protein A3G76_13020 [Acidobacteria bacterium RIFCSPLOWO2_12_FULL_65_11]
MDLDPDLWLCTRLTLGRGWRLATALALWTAGLALIASGRLFLLPFLQIGSGAENSPRLLELALFVLINAPVRPLARLLDAERDGLLDHTRLCGRPPHRVLFAFLFGSISPLVLVAIFMLANHLRFGGDVRSIYLAVLVFGGALAASLIAYSTLPPSMTPDSRFLTPLLFVFGGVAFYAVAVYAPVEVPWVRDLAFGEPAALTTIALVTIGLPLGIWLAGRRLVRAPQSLSREGFSEPFDSASRLLPRRGPAEFTRQLRRALRSGGTLAILIGAPLVVLIGVQLGRADRTQPLLNAIPYAVLLVGAFAASMTVRAEIESATIDFVRLTPQRPEAIVVSWYVALALPFWIAIVCSAFALAFIAPDVFSVRWPLVAIAALLPAFSLTEGFQRRKPATYLWLPCCVVPAGMAAVFFTSTAGFRVFVPTVSIAWTPWSIDLRTFVPAIATALALGTAAGRMRRPDGPALAGAAAAAGVIAVAVSVLVVPSSHVLRMLPCALVMLASFAAEERDPPTAPWWRMGVVGAAAFVAVAALAHDAGVGASLTSGLCAALALGIGVLAHELFWRVPAISLGVRLVVMLGLLRAPRLIRAASGERFLPGDIRIPRLFEVGDVVALAAVFVAVAVAHAVVRARHMRT